MAPPSEGATRRYRIIRGSLDNLDRLPVARIPDELLTGSKPQRESSGSERIPKGRRNSELFAYCSSIIAYCDTPDQLIDAAWTWADGRLALPLPTAEITKTCNSVWQYRGVEGGS